MAQANYPLVLKPHLAARVWGGSRLGKGIGEAWDLSVHPHGPSVIANGPLQGRTLADVNRAAPEDFGGPIRLLAKRLDCAEDLSIQVHPKRGDPKTESWVVLQGRPGAGVYHGWRGEVTAEEAKAAAQDGSLPRRMRFVPVGPGQCVFVPSGTVHAIGGGLLLFELQQSADTTYRLFDWGRGRDLHLDEGLACTDFANHEPLPVARARAGGVLRLVECPFFFIDRVDTHRPATLDPGDAWCAVLLVAGSARVGTVALKPGSTLIVPRAAGSASLHPDAECTALIYGPPPGR